MNRYVLIFLFVVVLVSPLALSWRLGRQVKVTNTADEELVVITPNPEGIRREFADAFKEYYQSKFGKTVNVDYRTFGAGDIARYFRETSRTLYKDKGTYGIDVAWGGGDSFFETELKKPGYIQPVHFSAAFMEAVYPKPDIGGLPLYDPDTKNGPCWFGTALSSFGIVYNREIYKKLGIPEPKTWKDLADPRLQGWVVLADPTRSYSAKQAYMSIIERSMADAKEKGISEDIGWADGMGIIRLISANARLYTDSGSVVPIMVSQGECAAGMAIDFYGRSQADAVGQARMAYIEPANATMISPDPVALVTGAPHKELGIEFIRFLLSREGQRLWCLKVGAAGGPKQSVLWRQPVRADVYSDTSNFVMPLNPFAVASTFNKSAEREKTFNIVGELMQFSCIDLLDELHKTRAAIAASPRHEELDAKLGRFPFDQKEAMKRTAVWLARPTTRPAATVPGTQSAIKALSPAERLELQRKWTNEFREEYEKLREEAAAR